MDILLKRSFFYKTYSIFIFLLLACSWIIHFNNHFINPMLSFLENISTSFFFFIACWSCIMNIKSSYSMASSWSASIFLDFLKCLALLVSPFIFTNKSTRNWFWQLQKFSLSSCPSVGSVLREIWRRGQACQHVASAESRQELWNPV